MQRFQFPQGLKMSQCVPIQYWTLKEVLVVNFIPWQKEFLNSPGSWGHHDCQVWQSIEVHQNAQESRHLLEAPVSAQQYALACTMQVAAKHTEKAETADVHRRMLMDWDTCGPCPMLHNLICIIEEHSRNQSHRQILLYSQLVTYMLLHCNVMLQFQVLFTACHEPFEKCTKWNGRIEYARSPPTSRRLLRGKWWYWQHFSSVTQRNGCASNRAML